VGRALALAVLALAVLAAPAAAQQPLGAWGQTGSAPYQYRELGGVAADGRGYVYAADNQGGGVLKYTTAGAYVRTIGRPKPPRNIGDPPPPDTIRIPEGLAIGPDGNLYVVEGGTDRTRVSVWSPTGGYLRSFGDFGSGPGQLYSPKQVALDAAGFVYVADSGNSRVQKFSPGGQFVASIGQGSSTFTDPDKLSDPEGVALAPDGSLYASDQLYRRVQHYAADGTFLGSFGSQGSGDGQFEAPVGLIVAPDGIFVADRSLSSIQRFGLGGGFLGRLGGTPGGGPGQFSHPFYLTVDCRGTLYVADRDNNRIQRLGAPGAPPCGDPATDASERLVLAATAPLPQRFRRDFAVRARVGCDRPCTVTVGGSVRIKGRRHALKIRSQTRAVDGVTPFDARVAPREKDTDRVLAALKRHKRVTATLRVTAKDLRGQQAGKTLRVRLR
jgi:DNA-binding beta-propeller fold protein YncE